MLNQLAILHASYDVYIESQMNGEVQDNIVLDIEEIEELRYLSYFYYQYFEDYLHCRNGGTCDMRYFKGEFRPRSIHLPFLGSETIRRKKADNFFVFKGSLEEQDQLSITALSCFWLFNKVDKVKEVYEKFNENLQYVHPFIKGLGITREIAENSYVTEFERVTKRHGMVDFEQSKQLILDEIELLQPEVIVLVGSDVKNAFAWELSMFPKRFIFIPYRFNSNQEPLTCLSARAETQEKTEHVV